jgi:hypothetical protein
MMVLSSFGDHVDAASFEKYGVITLTSQVTGESVILHIDPEEMEAVVSLAVRDNRSAESDGGESAPVLEAAQVQQRGPEVRAPFQIRDAGADEDASVVNEDPTSDGF